MKTIFFMIFCMSVLHAEFIKSGNIVTDSVSGLQWQDTTDMPILQWEDAVHYCSDLALDGAGWRLPNINELKSIIDRSKQNYAMVTGFENPKYSHWSSTTKVDGPRVPWAVLFEDGIVISGGKEGGSFARCVRNGQ